MGTGTSTSVGSAQRGDAGVGRRLACHDAGLSGFGGWGEKQMLPRRAPILRETHRYPDVVFQG